jgi:hypothetical protein
MLKTLAFSLVTNHALAVTTVSLSIFVIFSVLALSMYFSICYIKKLINFYKIGDQNICVHVRMIIQKCTHVIIICASTMLNKKKY